MPGNQKRLSLFDPEFVERRSNAPHSLTPNVARRGDPKQTQRKASLCRHSLLDERATESRLCDPINPRQTQRKASLCRHSLLDERATESRLCDPIEGRKCEGGVEKPFFPILQTPIDPTLDENQRANPRWRSQFSDR